MKQRAPRLWKHFERSETGETAIIASCGVFNIPYDYGQVTTGRQRVFAAYYVRVNLPDGTSRCGENRDGAVQALRNLATQLSGQNLFLLAAALDPRFYSTGLTGPGPWGYIEGQDDRAYHMMELPPPKDRDPVEEAALDAMIQEAVSRIGRSPTSPRR